MKHRWTKTFESKDTPLNDALEKISNGIIQIPDFQRSWYWTDEQVVSLLDSVASSYPIGAITMLRLEDIQQNRFQYRTIEGVTNATRPPRYLILDGQQRLTALYQGIRSEFPAMVNVNNRSNSKTKKMYYYIDIKKSIASSNLGGSFFSVPANKFADVDGFGKLDLSNSEHEFMNDCFPLKEVFQFPRWRQEYEKFHHHEPAKSNLMLDFEDYIIKSFNNYRLPLIELEADTEREAICIIFEKSNTSGTKLKFSHY